MSGLEPGRPADADDVLVVISADDLVAGQRRRAPRPEATTTLSLTISEELARGLADALAILPGADLDQLASRALQQVVARLGLTDAARRPRRRYDSRLIVIL